MTGERRALTASNRRWRKVAWISSGLVALLSLFWIGWPVLGYVAAPLALLFLVALFGSGITLDEIYEDRRRHPRGSPDDERFASTSDTSGRKLDVAPTTRLRPDFTDRVRRRLDDEGVGAHVSLVRARAVGADDTPVLRIVSVSPPRTVEVIEESDAYSWVGYVDLEIEIPLAECYISDSDLLAVISALAAGRYSAEIPRPRLWRKLRVTVAGDAGTPWIFYGRPRERRKGAA